ncbi:MAG TPA: helix-turn-helix domain-containing protein [Terriglobia bacterium]
MANQEPFPEGCLPKLREAVKRARSKWQLQQAQCLLLRAEFGFPAWQVAELIGWTVTSVRRFQARYLREGDAALAGPGRGGRRNQALGLHAETDLLRSLRRELWPNSYVDAQVVREAYEKAAGRRVAPSTVYRMLARHGWRKVPTLKIPEPKGRAKTHFTKRSEEKKP